MTRDEINTYPIIVHEARWLADKIESMRVRIDAPRIPRLTGQPSARNAGSGSAQERYADEYMDTAPSYEDKLREVRAHLTRIEAAVDRLPPRERMVTRWHCMERLSYKYISSVMDISISLVSAIQINAYKLLEDEDKLEIPFAETKLEEQDESRSD